MIWTSEYNVAIASSLSSPSPLPQTIITAMPRTNQATVASHRKGIMRLTPSLFSTQTVNSIVGSLESGGGLVSIKTSGSAGSAAALEKEEHELDLSDGSAKAMAKA